MADRFKIHGSYSVEPMTGARSGDPYVEAPIDEYSALDNKSVGLYDLLLDTSYAVSFGGLARVNVLIVKSSSKISVAITSSDGSGQVIPVDGFLAIMTRVTPITAISLTRLAGVHTTANLFLGEYA